MKTGQVTIKHIARKLNISTSTVSRALRGMPEVHPETKKAVMELADVLNYEPNPIALSLVKKKTKTIGVVIPNMLDNLFANVVKGVQKVAVKAGYKVIISESHESFEEECRCLKSLISTRVDGILISFSSETKDFQHLEKLLENQTAVVQFDRTIEKLNTSLIKVDDYEGARSVVRHLTDIGCRRIAFIGGPQNLDSFRNRFSGYRDELQEQGLDYDESLIQFTGFEITYGIELTKSLFDLSCPPDGIFANSDSLALGAIKYLTDHAVDPTSVAVVGFSNERFSSFVNPSITTVDQRSVEMGETAMRMLLTQILVDPAVCTPEKVSLKTDLIVRESTLRFRKGL